MNPLDSIKNKLIKEINACSSVDEIYTLFKKMNSTPASQKAIEGRYLINGNNQDEHQTPYSGRLDITALPNGRYEGLWTIGNSQIQFGKGFRFEDTLVFNFHYSGEGDFSGQRFKGVVIYSICSNGNLKGFWSEKHGDQRFLGKENGVKQCQVQNHFCMN